MSAVKVRRILITENLWSSEKSEEIRLLTDRGKNVQEIADILNVSVKAVEAYMPYQRGMFQGVEVSVPKRPDIFLAMQYGDYMQLPPEHQRIAHRLIRWKTWEASGPNRDDGGND